MNSFQSDLTGKLAQGELNKIVRDAVRAAIASKYPDTSIQIPSLVINISDLQPVGWSARIIINLVLNPKDEKKNPST